MTYFDKYQESKIFFPVAIRDLCGKGRDGTYKLPVTDHRAVYRPGPMGQAQCLGVVGTRYQPVMMRDLCDMAEQALTELLPSNAFLNMEVRDKMIGDGAKVWREYVFPTEGACIEQPTRGTTVAYKVVVGNSYDGSMAAYGGCGSEDLVCENGMISVNYSGKVVRKHTAGFDMEYFKIMFERGIEDIKGHVDILQQWNKTTVNPAKVELFLEEHFSERRAERLLGQVRKEYKDRGRTLWAVYSALTFYASHDDWRFPVRGADNSNNVAGILMNRQEEVHRLVRGRDFMALAA